MVLGEYGGDNRLLGVDYSTVSQGKKRLTEKMKRDRKFEEAYQSNRAAVVNMKDLSHDVDCTGQTLFVDSGWVAAS